MTAMAEVTVAEQANGTFRVDVRAGRVATSHVVTIPAGHRGALGCDDVPAGELVRASIAFLLEHEPPNSILRRFRLDQIADYFPEFPTEIATRLHAKS
jgi:hypothetical protein